tara:strand:- start:1363 stop:1620 length:258 start_codon:yes stop_codon:yes gene_type:complete
MRDGLEGNHVYDVKVFDSGNFLGYLSVLINDEEMKNKPLWEGQILGSDYLVWGLNHRKVKLQFENGAEVEAVVRSGGRIFQILSN